MSENYLWDKTGEDREIEKLENALKSLRYRESAAPSIPIKTASEKKSSFRFFPFLIPAFACLLIALSALNFWVKDAAVSPDETAKNDVQTQTVIQKNDAAENVAPISETAQTVKYEEKSGARRRLNKLPKIRPAYVRVNSTTAQKNKKTNPPDVLTKEEKYAYDQLMTALAITGSQFKLVRDKVQGIDNQTADINGGR